METQSINRRVLATSLFGAAGAAVVVAMMPPSSEAIAKVLMDEEENPSLLPNLDNPSADTIEDSSNNEPQTEEGEQLAWHNGYRHRRRRRRRRVRRWRRICRREYWNGFYRRRCRRRPFWIWLSIG